MNCKSSRSWMSSLVGFSHVIVPLCLFSKSFHVVVGVGSVHSMKTGLADCRARLNLHVAGDSKSVESTAVRNSQSLAIALADIHGRLGVPSKGFRLSFALFGRVAADFRIMFWYMLTLSSVRVVLVHEQCSSFCPFFTNVSS